MPSRLLKKFCNFYNSFLQKFIPKIHWCGIFLKQIDDQIKMSIYLLIINFYNITSSIFYTYTRAYLKYQLLTKSLSQLSKMNIDHFKNVIISPV